MLKFLKKSYSSLNGHLFSIIGIAVSGIPLYFNMNAEISIKVLFPLLIVTFVIVTILMRALFLASTQMYLPIIRKGLDSYRPYDAFSFLALIDPYKLFTFNTIVSVFYISDGVEELIGTGRVLNVQQNEKLLIGVKLIEDRELLKTSIIKNSQEVIKNVVIKPMVEV